MRLRQIEITKLFGLFDHRIPLRDSERITILHGPNGFGKTTILRLLHALFSKRLQVVRGVPFASFVLSFDDGSMLTIDRASPTLFDVGSKRERDAPVLRLAYETRRGPTESFTYAPAGDRTDEGWMVHRICRVIDHLDRVGPNEIEDRLEGDTISVAEALERYSEELERHGIRIAFTPLPPWLKDLLGTIPIQLIETQRLFVRGPTRRSSVQESEQRTGVSVVSAYSAEIIQAIKTKLAESAALSQSLDRTFPTRLLGGEIGKPPDEHQLRSVYATQVEKRSRLMNAGLLAPAPEGDVALPDRVLRDTEKEVLWLYVQDTTRKLNVFNELLERIELLVAIVNSHFEYKRLAIEKDRGFTVRLADSAAVPLASLSSGEQHELVVLYQLLFKTNPNSLVLIDEPELSLHVTWQQRFLENLHRMAGIVKADFLIATHSPQIIHERWDLAVGLSAPHHDPTTFEE